MKEWLHLHDCKPSVWRRWRGPLFLSLQLFWDKKIKRWRSVGEQNAKYSRCVPVRPDSPERQAQLWLSPVIEEKIRKEIICLFLTTILIFCAPLWGRDAYKKSLRIHPIETESSTRWNDRINLMHLPASSVIWKGTVHISRYQMFLMTVNITWRLQMLQSKCAHKLTSLPEPTS